VKPIQSGLSIFNLLNAELNPIFQLLALLGAQHILQVSKIRVNVGTAYRGLIGTKLVVWARQLQHDCSNHALWKALTILHGRTGDV